MKSFKIAQSITDRQDASLNIFFKEVSKIPMLDINEEIDLVERIKKGDKQAENRLIEANLRFVISVAKQYQNKGLPLVDLIQEGVIGMCQAATKYDETKGFKFISYAVWWIRQAIMQALSEQCRTVRVPLNQIAYVNKINKTIERYEQNYNRIPSISELEKETGLNASKLNTAVSSTYKSVSLDNHFKDDEISALLDIIPNPNNDDSDKNIESSELSNKIEEILLILSPRESDIVRMFFGIGMNPMQYEEIAARFGISYERARQIKESAVEKLRLEFENDLKELL